MEMTLRWYGSKFDSVTLEQIRQIPMVKGVITTLYDTTPGQIWEQDRVNAMKEEVEAAGLRLSGIESVNIHDDIKVGLPSRDQYIENYITTLEHLGKADIHMVCYNFMPVFDWTRSDLKKPLPDGSTCLSYDQELVDKLDFEAMLSDMEANSEGFVLPGWEPERMARVKELFELYKDVDEEKLFQNLVYFLKAIMPTCKKYGINMAIHPDDPAWPVFNLPRIITGKEKIQRLLDAVPDKENGLTLCTGSLGSNPKNDIPDMIRSFKGRIHFGHVRNVIHLAPGKFDEAPHPSCLGSLDMYEIMKALHDIGFDGPIRPDHGRLIWGEVAMPGYGLYDRALGATYLYGLWEAICRNAK
ncbi:MAG: mannonate dehydratase [Clostridia bacterium]|nr:mannonate dehydratase [Clostridia bacterium]